MSDWITREEQRMSTLYEVTQTLRDVNRQYPGYFIHVSQRDRSLVAYTQSIEKGIKDQQTPIKLGVLLRKLNNLWTDRHIANLVADHQAELLTSVRFFSGTGVSDSYRDHYWGSCMTDHYRKEHSQKPFKETYGIDVLGTFYDGNPIELAMVYDANGNPVGRSMVDRSRKIFIRSYGAREVVERTLKREGFKLGSLVETDENPRQFGVIVAYEEATQATIYLPYLDSMNQNGSSYRGCVVIHKDESATLALVRHEGQAYKNLQDNSFRLSAVNTTSGLATLPRYNREQFILKLGKSTIDLLAPGKVQDLNTAWVYQDGELQKMLQCDVPEDCVYRYTYYEGSRIKVLADRNVPTFSDFIDNDYNRQRQGYVKLSEKYYPENREWVQQWSTFQLDDGERVLDNHVALVYRGSMVNVWHEDPCLKDTIKVRKVLVDKAYADKIVRTASGVKALPGVDELVQAWNGTEFVWMFQRTAKRVSLGGFHVWVSRKDPVTALSSDTAREWLHAAMAGTLHESVSLGVHFERVRSRLLASYGIVASSGKYYHRDYYGRATSQLTQEEVFKRMTVPSSFSGDAINYQLKCWLAEAMAIDYNQQTPAVVQVPEIQQTAEVAQ